MTAILQVSNALVYHRFDPTDCNFPTPKVPILPGVGWDTFGQSKHPAFVQVGAERDVQHFSRGRYALTHAYRACGVEAGAALLAPAYHCRTMLDPAIRLGGSIVFYRQAENLAPDMVALEECLRTSPDPVKAMLVTHYFGFAQDMNPIISFCAAHQIDLIEDCSHAMFTHSGAENGNGSPQLGRGGRFGVASPYKFFPSEDGGSFWSNDIGWKENEPNMQNSWKDEARALRNLIRLTHIGSRHLTMLHTERAIPSINSTQKSLGSDLLIKDNGISDYYQPGHEARSSLKSSRWICRNTNTHRLIELRRKNYLRWVDAVSNLPNCRALAPELADQTVPYMFPLLLDKPEVHFFLLKRLGVPIWRWDDMVASGCKTAATYRLRLIHLPCHQELTCNEMTWLISKLKTVLQSKSVETTQ
jgi:perosamine synthetase